MRTAVIYKSVFHSTAQYARWLAEALGAELLPMNKAKDIARFDRVVIMSGTYAGGMPLVGYLKKHWPQLQGKEVVVVAVGAAPVDDPASRLSYEKIPPEIREQITYFKIRGATPFAKAAQREQEIRREHLTPVLQHLQRGE